MILVDVNLLVYAYNKTAPQHTAARKWFEALISGDELFLLPWHSILGFLRIATNPRASENPFAPEDAVEIVDRLAVATACKGGAAGRQPLAYFAHARDRGAMSRAVDSGRPPRCLGH